MKILYLTYDGLTDPLGLSQVLAYLEKLNAEDRQIFVQSFEKKENYQLHQAQVARRCEASGLRWVPRWYTKRPPILSTCWDIWVCWRASRKLVKENAIDIVHCRGYITAIVGLLLRRKLGTRFIFDMRGWWVDEKIESGAWSGPIHQGVIKLFRRLERKFFEKSDFVVSLTEVGKNKILEEFQVSPDQVGVVHTCVDFRYFPTPSEVAKREAKIRLGIPPTSRLVIYSGSLGGNYPIDTLVEVVNQVLSDERNYFLVISQNTTFLEPFLSEIEHPSRLLLRSSSYQELHQLLWAGDEGLVFYKAGVSNLGRCPTKLGEYWACGMEAVFLGAIGDLQLWQEEGYPVKSLEGESFTKPPNFSTFDAAKELFGMDAGLEFYNFVYKKLYFR